MRRFWQSRVLGDFPEQAEDARILRRWLEAAGTRVVSSDGGTLYAGIEVAGPGEDETVVVIRGSVGAILTLQAWDRRDPRGEVAPFLTPSKDRYARAVPRHQFGEMQKKLTSPRSGLQLLAEGGAKASWSISSGDQNNRLRYEYGHPEFNELAS